MQRARSYRIVSVLLVVGLAGFVALLSLSACSNYSEGDRCESLNGNNDCVDGLQCTPKSQLSVPFNSSDRCCPPDRTRATTAACSVPQNPIAGDSAPPSETGPSVDATIPETSTVDTGTDAADAADAADADGG